MRLDRLRAASAFGIAVAIAAVACGGDTRNADPIAAPARRIVVMAPAAAEVLAALGATDRIVGVGDFVKRPAELTRLPHVGAYNTPNVERVLALEADVLITTASDAAAAGHRRLAALGVDVLALDTSTYDGVFHALGQIGRLVGDPTGATEIERRIRRQLRSIRERARELPPRRVLFVVGSQPLYVAGPGSHVDEMISLVGATNVAGDALTPYARVSMEAILERMPEVIIDTSDNRPDALRGRAHGSWGEWTFLPAVRNDRVYWIDPDLLVIPGIRLPEMTRLMARLVQPETFGEVDDRALGGR